MNSLPRRFLQKLSSPFERFARIEASGGIVLLAATLFALYLANSTWSESYEHLVEYPLHLALGPWVLELTLHEWVNDALMAIFFFVVGLEIKRELVAGELASPKKAALPIFAALGGMIVPALIYLTFNYGQESGRGWGIPMATDIAFAVGVLTLLGRRIPPGLKIFLLALAIVDDLGAVLVIALFYTGQISGPALAAAAASVAVVAALKKVGVKSYVAYWLLGAVLWLAVFKSGIHATIAGVVLGLMTPVHRPSPQRPSPVDQLTQWLHGWVSYFIMPVFALVNAGVRLPENLNWSEFLSHPIAAGVVLGLVAGKPMGVFIFSWVAVQLRFARLPSGVSWTHMLGAGFLAGIGFTMALFIGHLALQVPSIEMYSKLGILIGSLISALLGLAALTLFTPRDKSART